MTVKKSRQIIQARNKIYRAAKKLGFIPGDQILIATASSDIIRGFLNHFSHFEIHVKHEIRPTRQGISIEIQLNDSTLTDASESLSQNEEHLDIRNIEMKAASFIFDELKPKPEKEIVTSLTLIKWVKDYLTPAVMPK